MLARSSHIHTHIFNSTIEFSRVERDSNYLHLHITQGCRRLRKSFKHGLMDPNIFWADWHLILKSRFKILKSKTSAPARRPRRLLMVAIDGVAPQAKLKQQRTRRFMSAHVEALRASLEEEVALFASASI